jgi:hypothetical protein
MTGRAGQGRRHPDSPAGDGRPSAAGLGLGATVAVLVAGQAILWRAGAALPALPLHRAGFLRTLDEADPLALGVSVLRLVGLGAGAGLLATIAMGVVARCCGAARLVVHLDRWTPAAVRRLLDGALGAGLAASIGLSSLPAGADAERPPAPVPTLRRLPDEPPTTTLRRLPDAPPPASDHGPAGSPATLRRLADSPPAPPVVAPAPPAPMATDDREVVVAAGDSFWRLAEQHETERLGRRPTEAEVGACWQELVAVNRHRLAVPDDPDLLFPGQRLRVPCPERARA